MSQLSKEERALAREYGFRRHINQNGQEMVRYKLGGLRYVVVLPPGHDFGYGAERDPTENWVAYVSGRKDQYDLHAPTLAAALLRVHLEGWV